MTCPLAPKSGHRAGSKRALTCPYCNPSPPGGDEPEDSRAMLHQLFLPRADTRLRQGVTHDLDSIADQCVSLAAARGRPPHWLCPALTGWADSLDGTIFADLDEPRLKAELIRRHCPLWLAQSLSPSITLLLPKLTAAIGHQGSISLIVHMLAVWVCPVQAMCPSYYENMFRLTYEGFMAKAPTSVLV